MSHSLAHLSARGFSWLMLVLVIALGIGALATIATKHAPPRPNHDRTVANPPNIATPPAVSSDTAKQRAAQAYGRVPLQFEVNEGQTDSQVKFLARGQGYGLFLTASDAVLALRNADGATAVRMKLIGARSDAPVVGEDKLPGKANYFIGNDPSNWRRNIAAYARVKYEAIYPGIDLVYYGKQRQLEYDFVVASGADPSLIRLGFEGIEHLELEALGDLILYSAGGEIRQHKPLIFQEVDGMRQEIPGGYRLLQSDDGRITQVAFHVESYDATRPLVIDPTLAYSTFLGGTGPDGTSCGDFFGLPGAITVDANGNAYVTGCTRSADFPTTDGALDEGYNGATDAFVVKLAPDGRSVVYSTYLGSFSNFNAGGGIFVDLMGNAYVTGSAGVNFPTTPRAYDESVNGSIDAFVAKLDPSGSTLLYSTVLGGSFCGFGADADAGRGIAVDSAGHAYVTGFALSQNFPTTPGAFDTEHSCRNGFIAKLNPSGSALVYSTLLDDIASSIAVDADGNAYVLGSTTSAAFPTTAGAYDATHNGASDVFVLKLNPLGTGLVYSTFLGDSGDDSGFGIALDQARNAYVTGRTSSPNFPKTTNAYDTFWNGNHDVFVAKLDPSASSLVYSTFLGGGGLDEGRGIAVDAMGNVHLTGKTVSSDFPVTDDAVDKIQIQSEAFFTKLDPSKPSQGQLIYSTFLGGSNGNEGFGIAVDPAGNAYVTGFTFSHDYPTTPEAFDTTFNGSIDAFVAKFEFAPPAANLGITKSDSPDPVLAGDALTYMIVVANNGPGDATGVTVTDALPAGVTFVSASSTQGGCNHSGGAVSCVIGNLTNGSIATVTINVTTTASGMITNTATVKGNETDPETSNNTAEQKTTVSPVTCGGLVPTMVGTPGNDIITGTSAVDVIHGLSGNDTINGGNEKDVICGGRGDDRLDGGPGKDRLFGESGNDELMGEEGKDELNGGDGTDVCIGGKGANPAPVGCEVVL